VQLASIWPQALNRVRTAVIIFFFIAFIMIVSERGSTASKSSSSGSKSSSANSKRAAAEDDSSQCSRSSADKSRKSDASPDKSQRSDPTPSASASEPAASSAASFAANLSEMTRTTDDVRLKCRELLANSLRTPCKYYNGFQRSSLQCFVCASDFYTLHSVVLREVYVKP
jgi:hypothetical protein